MVRLGRNISPKTKNGKEMARMLISFCHLSKSGANTIVTYFGVSKMDKLADFHEEHWKGMLVELQKCHTFPNGSEQGLVLSPPQQDRIQVQLGLPLSTSDLLALWWFLAAGPPPATPHDILSQKGTL